MEIITTNHGVRIIFSNIDNPYVEISFKLNVGLDQDSRYRETSNYSKAHIIEHILANEFNNLANTKNYSQIKNKIYKSDEILTTAKYTQYKFIIDKSNPAFFAKFMLESLFYKQINKNFLETEIKRIEIEGTEKLYNGNGFMENKNWFNEIDGVEKTKEFFILEKEIKNIKEKMKNKNSNLQFLQNFYDKFYKPENLIITVNGVSKEDIKNIYEVVNDFFKNEKEKTPNYKSSKSKLDSYKDKYLQNNILTYEKDIYQYEVVKNKENYTDSVGIFIYFDIPNLKNNYYLLKLYEHFLFSINQDEFICSNLNSEMLKVMFKKRGNTYQLESDVNVVNNHIYFTILAGTNNKNVHNVLSGLRNVINKCADGKNHNIEVYENIKNSLYKAKKNEEITLNSDYLKIAELYAYEGYKIDFLPENYLEKIKKIKYHDFVNFCKFMAKTNGFIVRGVGNGITENDLMVFENGQKSSFSTRDELEKRNIKYSNEKESNYPFSNFNLFKNDDDEFEM